MHIKNVVINNFKGIESKTYEPNKITVFTGPIGSGKTSFMESLFYGFTGKSPIEPVKKGANTANVLINLDKVSLEREIKVGSSGVLTSAVKVNGNKTTQKSLDELFNSLVGVNKETIRVTSSSEVIKNLSAEEFGDFLLSYIPEQLTAAIVKSYISDLTKEEEAELDNWLPEIPGTFGTDLLKEIYDYYYSARTNAKKEYDLKKRLLNLELLNNIPVRTLQQIEADIEAQLKLEGAQKSLKDANEAYTKAILQRNKMLENITSLQKQIKENKSNAPEEAVLVSLNEEEKQLRENILLAQRTIQTLTDNVKLIKKTITNLSTNKCPISDQLICTTDKTAIKNELLQNEKSSLENIQAQQKRISIWEESLKNTEEKKKQYNEQKMKYAQKITLEKQLASLQATLGEEPVKPEAFTPLDPKVKEALLREKKYCSDFEQMLNIKKEHDIAKAQAELYDKIVKDFAPKGTVMNSIISYYVTTFEEICNERAKTLNVGIQIKFLCENGIHIYADVEGKGTYHYKSCSTGEQILIMFLIMDMLNQVSGLNLLFIDELSSLDKTSFEKLLSVLTSEEVLTSYDHIFLNVINHKGLMDALETQKKEFMTIHSL